nr:transcription initiation factor TFIID subunit 4b [Tanacetum cinerariifolium]
MNTQNASDRNPAQIIVRNPDMHKASSNQQAAAEQAANRPAGRQVPFAMLLPVLEPQLEKGRAMQLQTLYARLMSNSINKEEFVRNMRTLVGDYMLKMAVYKLRQEQLQQKRMNLPQPSFPTYGNPGGNFHQSASANMGMPAPSNKQQSHDLQMRQGPVNPAMAPQAMSQHALNNMKRLHGDGHAHFTSNPALQKNSSHWQASMHKDQSLVSSNPYATSDSADQMNDQQHRSHLSTPQGLEHVTGGPGSSEDDTFEAMSSRRGSITAQLERQNAAATAAAKSSLASGGNAKTPPRKPIVVQKKPLEAPINPLSKKQKVVGAFADQSIDQLNDVTAVSGVNLRIPVRQYAQSASSSLQSDAITLPADQRPRLLERQLGSHGVKASHVPNANCCLYVTNKSRYRCISSLSPPPPPPPPSSSDGSFSNYSTLQVSFATLLQFLEPQLDKDLNVQLQGLFARLRNNRINREKFIGYMRTLVGDYTLWMAMYTLQQGPESR